MSFAKFQSIGNLTRDPDTQILPGRDARGTFDLGVNRNWRDSNGKKNERTDFLRIKCWGKMAENATNYLKKGSKIYVEGRIETSTYVRDGVTVHSTDFVAEYIEYLDKVSGARSGMPIGAGE